MIKDENGKTMSFIASPDGNPITKITSPDGKVIHQDCVRNEKFVITAEVPTSGRMKVSVDLKTGVWEYDQVYIKIYGISKEEQYAVYSEVTADTPGGSKTLAVFFTGLTRNTMYSARARAFNKGYEANAVCVGRTTLFVT